MFDLETLIKTGGYLGLFAIIFAETGLLVGFFLPGDSLLFTAGILASQGFLDIKIVLFTLFFAAVAGDNTGYFIGHKFGKKLFHKEDSLLFHKEHLVRAKSFYEKHGGKTIIIARFMPIIRTFSAIVAGIGDMPYAAFLTFDIIGGLLWAVGIPLLGFFLGSVIPDIDKFLLPIIALIIFFSILPGLQAILKNKENRDKIVRYIASIIKKS